MGIDITFFASARERGSAGRCSIGYRVPGECQAERLGWEYDLTYLADLEVPHG
ncbi:MAG: hypothetical protein GY842_24885 [bacterium]|nr:hypothetical protein [bacterium]